MFRKDKHGFELSLNMIIIAVIAIVFLGVALMLVRNWGTMIQDEIPKVFPPSEALWQPTIDDPVVFSPAELTVKKGKSNDFLMQVYNYASTDVDCIISFVHVGEDSPLEFLYSEATRAIPVDMVGQWKIPVKASKTAIAGSYLYTSEVNCGEFIKQTDIIIEVS